MIRAGTYECTIEDLADDFDLKFKNALNEKNTGN